MHPCVWWGQWASGHMVNSMASGCCRSMSSPSSLWTFSSLHGCSSACLEEVHLPSACLTNQLCKLPCTQTLYRKPLDISHFQYFFSSSLPPPPLLTSLHSGGMPCYLAQPVSDTAHRSDGGDQETSGQSARNTTPICRKMLKV